MFDVDSVILGSGRCPMKEFLESLDNKSASKIESAIQGLREHGFIPFPMARKLEGTFDLWEIRVSSRGLSLRIFYAYVARNKAVLISGFVKKSRKTPGHELRRAINLLKGYRVSHENNAN